MTRTEIEQVIHALANLGFTVEWYDAKSETFLIRATPARAA